MDKLVCLGKYIITLQVKIVQAPSSLSIISTAPSIKPSRTQLGRVGGMWPPLNTRQPRIKHALIPYLIWARVVCLILYNWNIWQKEILANRLNFPIGENLNWRNSMVGSRDFTDATIGTHEQARKARHALKLRLKNSLFS